jgi:predicted ATPase/class 3 adenylate cyclase
MPDLPSGTVTLLFSDIEGSTRLLARLGSAYAEALDGQRRVLREAWSRHRGVELGTEGDSFYVVFPTATDAVAAAAEGQRHLHEFPWPAGEDVRVRMGIHTGNPVVHAGAYVGMDVHRAARIASTAHGGQVVLSAATAELVSRSVPDGVGLRDLGRHELKDIERAEHLHQLVLDGLNADFPPLKSLGAPTSLPVPATPTVGREGELAELSQLLKSAEARIVTLTGPGGSGKTRLATELARAMVSAYPDGVYFVPLSTVTESAVMWTSIAESLDVPPDVSSPDDLVAHLQDSRLLLVLDNLEQLSDAASVVSDLVARAPHVTVIVTSRRPLHVGGEHEHAVPPLELPTDTDIDAAARSGAVQLFVQQAQRVKSAFELTGENAGDIASICRQLDGLPLAVELVASRSKLLSPKALLARLDMALDIRTIDQLRPGRQQTLREAIAWSYDLLTPEQQQLLRRVAVFSGGADLDAVTAVATDADSGGLDVLELITDLVDASLLTVVDDSRGEPRVGMLETIRTFAREQLATSGELDLVQARHALHYLRFAETYSGLFSGNRYFEARTRLESEQENLREALAWSTSTEVPDDGVDRSVVALDLCAAMGRFWWLSGYFSEGRRWVEAAIAQAGSSDQLRLARCLSILANEARIMGDWERAYETATASVEMWRRIGTHTRGYPYALRTLAAIVQQRGDTARTRVLYEQAVAVSREMDDTEQLHFALSEFGSFAGHVEDMQLALELEAEAVDVALARGDSVAVIGYRHNHACSLRMLGQPEQAHDQIRSIVVDSLALGEPTTLISLTEDYAAILAALGHHRQAVRMFGSADATSQSYGWPRGVTQEAELAGPIAETRAALTAEEWSESYDAGRLLSVEDALREAYDAPIGTLDVVRRKDVDPLRGFGAAQPS